MEGKRISEFNETEQYENLLKTVRDWTAETPGNWTRDHYGAELFKLVSAGFDSVTLKVLEEWVISADERQLRNVAALLRQANSNFVWDNSTFVINLLEKAQKFGNDCYRKVSSYLYELVLQGVRSGTPGQPFPQDIEQRDRSLELMKRLPVGSPAYKFYKTLYEEALAAIKRHSSDDIDD